MTQVRSLFVVALCCAATLTACGGSTPTPDAAPGTPTVPTAAPTSDNPFLDDYTPPEDDRSTTFFGGDEPGDDEGCEHRFDVDLFVAAEGDRPDWTGEGRLMINNCAPPDAPYDGTLRVRLPDVNRAVNVKMHNQEDSTDLDKHFIGRKVRGSGHDNDAALVLWEVDAHVTQHSVHPFVRASGEVTRTRTRWMLGPNGNLEMRDDELTATFEGVPTEAPEPKDCPDL